MMAMKNDDASSESIKPLLVHPPPKADDTILGWVKKLASANSVSNRVMFLYLTEKAKQVGFLPALHVLTRVPLDGIEGIDNEFKEEYWKNARQCPIKGCSYKTKKRSTILRHLNLNHGL